MEPCPECGKQPIQKVASYWCCSTLEHWSGPLGDPDGQKWDAVVGAAHRVKELETEVSHLCKWSAEWETRAGFRRTECERLRQRVETVCEERDNYRKNAEDAEKKLAQLQEAHEALKRTHVTPPEEVARLRRELAAADRQVELLTSERGNALACVHNGGPTGRTGNALEHVAMSVFAAMYVGDDVVVHEKVASWSFRAAAAFLAEAEKRKTP